MIKLDGSDFQNQPLPFFSPGIPKKEKRSRGQMAHGDGEARGSSFKVPPSECDVWQQEICL